MRLWWQTCMKQNWKKYVRLIRNLSSIKFWRLCIFQSIMGCVHSYYILLRAYSNYINCLLRYHHATQLKCINKAPNNFTKRIIVSFHLLFFSDFQWTASTIMSAISLHPWQIELDFVIPADRHLAVFTSPAYKDDITVDQWVLWTVSCLGRCKMAAPIVYITPYTC